MAGERCGYGGAGLADMGNDGLAAVHVLDRKFHERATLAVRQADGLARVHRQRQPVGAVGEVELDDLREAIEVDGALARERRHRRVQEAWLIQRHAFNPSDHQPCGSLSRMPSRSSSLRI